MRVVARKFDWRIVLFVLVIVVIIVIINSVIIGVLSTDVIEINTEIIGRRVSELV